MALNTKITVLWNVVTPGSLTEM